MVAVATAMYDLVYGVGAGLKLAPIGKDEESTTPAEQGAARRTCPGYNPIHDVLRKALGRSYLAHLQSGPLRAT